MTLVGTHLIHCHQVIGRFFACQAPYHLQVRKICHSIFTFPFADIYVRSVNILG